MMNILMNVLYVAAMLAVAILIFIGGKKFVFSKVRINKWIPLAISVVLLVAQFVMKIENFYVNAGLTLVTVAFFMWFIDIQTTGGPKVIEKKIVIKPKAKPNRVKHLKKDESK